MPDFVRLAMPEEAGTSKSLLTALMDATSEGAAPHPPPLAPEQAKTLAQTLASALLTREAGVPSAAAPGAPPPPYRGAPLSAQPPATPTIAPDSSPREIADRLISDTDGAIARTTLMQAASLPDQSTTQQRTDAAQRWTFEVPFAMPQGTGIAQFEVSRDARGRHMDEHERIWRARFSLNVEPMGPVHALVTLVGERAGVTLWAERSSTVTRLREHAGELTEQLRAAELEPSDFLVRNGAPPVAAKSAAPGRFMDRAT
jgi:hypothetical protein